MFHELCKFIIGLKIKVDTEWFPVQGSRNINKVDDVLRKSFYLPRKKCVFLNFLKTTRLDILYP